jgi:hypothetical protein
MPATPKRLYGPALIATGPTTVYTVPALTKTRIKHLHLQNPSGSPVTFSLSVGADAAGTRLWDAYSIPAAAAGVTDNVRPIWTDIVLEAAETIQLKAGTTNILTITVVGEELTLG